MGLLNHAIVLLLIFQRTSILFSTVTVLFCLPTNSAQRFQFLHILTNTCYFLGAGWQIWFPFKQYDASIFKFCKMFMIGKPGRWWSPYFWVYLNSSRTCLCDDACSPECSDTGFLHDVGALWGQVTFGLKKEKLCSSYLDVV